jgi:hypothetical protein
VQTDRNHRAFAGTVAAGGNLSAVRTLRWEPVARTLLRAGYVGKFIIRQRAIRVFALAAVCLVIYFFWHAALLLRLSALFGMLGLRIFSATRYEDPRARGKACYARKRAKLDAITEARLRKEPWRRPRPPLSVPEEHVGRYIGNYPGAEQHVMHIPFTDERARAQGKLT